MVKNVIKETLLKDLNLLSFRNNLKGLKQGQTLRGFESTRKSSLAFKSKVDLADGNFQQKFHLKTEL